MLGFSSLRSWRNVQAPRPPPPTIEQYVYIYYIYFTFYRGTGLTVYQISNILEGKVKLPEITSITLIPNDDNQAGTDEDSDDDENLEPKSMDRFGRGILNSMAEIDFLDEDEELPDVTEVSFCVVILYF